MMRKAFVLSFLISLLLCGCLNKGPYDQRAVDDLSRSVKKMMGNDFDFHGLSMDENGRKCYSFGIKTITAEAIGNIVEEVNRSLPDSEEYISLRIEIPISAGTCKVMFYMQNFSEGENGIEFYEHAKTFAIMALNLGARSAGFVWRLPHFMVKYGL